MYGKPYLDTNAHIFAAVRTIKDMGDVAADKSLSDLQRQLARQCRDIAASLVQSLKESNNGRA